MKHNKLKEILNKNNEYDQLIIFTRGLAYDSLIYRFKDYQARAFPIEVADYKFQNNTSEQDARRAINERHVRDLMKFIEILDTVIGEHA